MGSRCLVESVHARHALPIFEKLACMALYVHACPFEVAAVSGTDIDDLSCGTGLTTSCRGQCRRAPVRVHWLFVVRVSSALLSGGDTGVVGHASRVEGRRYTIIAARNYTFVHSLFVVQSAFPYDVTSLMKRPVNALL